jgi:hypothetical protein
MKSFLSDCREAYSHFMELPNGGPPGPERMRGEQGGGRLARLRRASPVRNSLK